MELNGKVAWITGGASGLGAATVKLLVEKGAKVMATDVNETLGQAFIAQFGDNAIFVRADVADTEDNQHALAVLLNKWGKVDILLNSAGIGSAEGTILNANGPADLNLFKKTIDINLVGTYDCLRLAAAAMTRNTPNESGERGVIINVSSAFYRESMPGSGSYCASKAAVSHLTEIAAQELGALGIRVLAIAPGMFDTPIMGPKPSPVRTLFANACAFPVRGGEPPEFAALVAHLAENVYFNGTTVEIDGCWRLGNWGTIMSAMPA